MSLVWKNVATCKTFEEANSRRISLMHKNPSVRFKVRKYGRPEDQNLRFVVKECLGFREDQNPEA